MKMTERCEPPEGLRGQAGWYWLEVGDVQYCHRWWRARGEWGWATLDPRSAASMRYVAPVATPAEVAEQRLELLDAFDRIADMEDKMRIAEEASAAARRQWAEVGMHPEEARRLRARVAGLEGELREIRDWAVREQAPLRAQEIASIEAALDPKP